VRGAFEENAAVIVDEEGVPKGSEVKGPVAREVAERFGKVASAASIIV
jgi:large subunit ribosomal protein L14